jgi:hypothetical protein
MGEQSASLKLTEQIITDLLCCYKCFPKESLGPSPLETDPNHEVFGI